MLEGYLGYDTLPDTRLQAADLVLALDYSRVVLAWRLLKRHIRYHNKKRPEMPSGCREVFGWPALRAILRDLRKADRRANFDNWLAGVCPTRKIAFKNPLKLEACLRTRDL